MIDDKLLLNALTTMFPDHTFSLKPVEGGRILTVDEDPVSRVRWVFKNVEIEAPPDGLQQEIDNVTVRTIFDQVTSIIETKEKNTIIPKLHKCLCGKVPKVVTTYNGGGGHSDRLEGAYVVCECGLQGKTMSSDYYEYQEKYKVEAAKWWNDLFEKVEV